MEQNKNNQTPPPAPAHDVNPSQTAGTETHPPKPPSTGSGQAKRKLPFPKILVAGIVILFTLVSFGLIAYLMMGNQTKQQAITTYEECVAAGYPIMESYPEKCSANGQTFTRTLSPEEQKKSTINNNVVFIKPVNMQFELPEKLIQSSYPIVNVLPGETGTFICVQSEDEYIPATPPQRTSGCFSENYAISGYSTEYSEGRGGVFLDHIGYKNENGKYYAIHNYNFTQTEIDSAVITEIENQNNVEVIKIGNKNEIDELFPQGRPATGTPEQGYYGALINTNNEEYPGLAVRINKELITEDEFDELLKSFKFTDSDLSSETIDSGWITTTSSKYNFKISYPVEATFKTSQIPQQSLDLNMYGYDLDYLGGSLIMNINACDIGLYRDGKTQTINIAGSESIKYYSTITGDSSITLYGPSVSKNGEEYLTCFKLVLPDDENKDLVDDTFDKILSSIEITK